MMLKKVTGPGQVCEGDALILELKDDRVIAETAKKVLFPGDSGEEVVYRKKRNYSFITGMVVDGSSYVRSAWVATKAENPAGQEGLLGYLTKRWRNERRHERGIITGAGIRSKFFARDGF